MCQRQGLLLWHRKSAGRFKAVRILRDNLLTNWRLNFGEASLLASMHAVCGRTEWRLARGDARFFSGRLHPLANRRATKELKYGCHIGG
jgi:hypothetical protein